MTSLEHDGAASLRVEWQASHQGRGQVGGGCGAGWYVVRICPCHRGHAITRPFGSQERAERALRALDFDARYLSPRKETK